MLYRCNTKPARNAANPSEKMHVNISEIARRPRFLVAAAVCFVLGGCATSVTPSADKSAAFDPQKRAVERSAARWKALTDKRFDESFAYLSEASRVGTNAAEYAAAMQRMGFIAANVVSATCEEAVCTVKSTVTLPVFIKNVGARPQTVPVEERWIVNNNELWLIRR